MSKLRMMNGDRDYLLSTINNHSKWQKKCLYFVWYNWWNYTQTTYLVKFVEGKQQKIKCLDESVNDIELIKIYFKQNETFQKRMKRYVKRYLSKMKRFKRGYGDKAKFLGKESRNKTSYWWSGLVLTFIFNTSSCMGFNRLQL